MCGSSVTSSSFTFFADSRPPECSTCACWGKLSTSLAAIVTIAISMSPSAPTSVAASTPGSSARPTVALQYSHSAPCCFGAPQFSHATRSLTVVDPIPSGARRATVTQADDQQFVPPDPAPAAVLPVHARERLTQMRQHKFFTSDLSVNEFLLVKEVGFHPVGLVMGSSIYHIGLSLARWGKNMEMQALTQALYHARELAMVRMEEEADALAADGIVGVRLTVNLHAWGSNVIEFLAIGTAVASERGGTWRAPNG